jgi:Sap, sulfolipid-1-addressing protein
MAHILVLACLAALFPLMLAAVVVILTRPRPTPLLLSFLIGGWAMSVTTGVLVLHAFEGADPEVLGSSETVPPGAYLFGGVLCLAVAYLMGTDRGAALRARRAAKRPATPAKEGPSRAERALGGDRAALAFAVGAVINVPGVYYLSALHDMATGGYSNAEQIALIVLFNLVMFALVEVPLVSYAISPEKTAERVRRFQDLLTRNASRIVAVLALGFGIALIAKGVAGLA